MEDGEMRDWRAVGAELAPPWIRVGAEQARPLHSLVALRQRQRDELRRMIAAADRRDDVLLALVQVGHRRAGDARAELGLPQRLAVLLVEHAELLAAAAGRRADVDLIAVRGKQQRAGQERRAAGRVAERRQVQSLERRMIAR